MATVSIIVTAQNEAHHLRTLKHSIDCARARLTHEIETILIDNRSTDHTPEIARRLGFSRVISLPEANLPTCRNHGAALSRGDWYCFIDADCELLPSWADGLRQALEQEPHLTGWPVAPPQPATWVQTAWHTHWQAKCQRLRRTDPHRLLAGANLICPKILFERLGGFNETCATGEDSELLLRAHELKLPIRAAPELALIHHGEPRTLRDFAKQQRWHAQRSRATNRKEHLCRKRSTRPQLYANLLLSSSFLACCALPCVLLTENIYGLCMMLPLAGTLAAPAAMTSLGRRKLSAFLPLLLLYFIYGWARSFTGLKRSTKTGSWRTAARSAANSPPGHEA